MTSSTEKTDPKLTSQSSVSSPLGPAVPPFCMVQQAINRFSTAVKHSAGLARPVAAWANCPLSFHLFEQKINEYKVY